ncbi:hypothetical protein [Bradyrhizobium sp. URHD0069]|uniref:hypothetical protein n=1 Tax=Bradyrhizobium sp. URHD0069 TaxID=1380355 RepID=UPI00068FA232|nr:hypothetical protein [Bradyrhizobium sp. URHD0069]
MSPELASICAELEIEVIPPHVTRTPGTTKCGNTFERIRRRYGEGHLILLLRTIMESENNRMALVEPVIWAISDVMLANPRWPSRGLEWLAAFDEIDLCEVWAASKEANGAPPERHGVASKITELMQKRFGEGKEEKLL